LAALDGCREGAAEARQGADIYERCGVSHINSKAASDVSQQIGAPMPAKHGRKKISTAVMSEGLAPTRSPTPGLEYRQLTKSNRPTSTLAALIRSQSGRVTQRCQTGTATGRLSSANQSADIPIRTESARDSRGLHRRAGHYCGGGLYRRSSTPACAFRKTIAVERFPRRRHSHPDRVAGFWRASADGDARTPSSREGGELRIVYACLLRLSQQLASRHEAKKFIDAYSKNSGVAHSSMTLEQRARAEITSLFDAFAHSDSTARIQIKRLCRRTAVNTPLRNAHLIKLAMSA